MIITKNDGINIIKVDIVIFKSKEVEVWLTGRTEPILVPIPNILTIS